MMKLPDFIEQLKGISQNLTLRQRIITGSVVALVLAGFAALFFLTNQATYKTLYTDLDSQDAAEVIKWLKKENVPYKIAQGGNTIKVPEDKVYDVRLSLAGAGLPSGSGVGFEIFDRNNLGTTDFVQRVNYQRALQGELEKTIEQFPQVRSARVHIAQPKESLFVTDRQPTTASVVLTMKRGARLNSRQISAIVHLTACAVPRLSEDNISVVDTTGNVLYESKDGKDNLADHTNAQLLYQKRLEGYYKRKIQSMLENALGPDKAVVRVSAEIDFDQVQTSEDRFDPDLVAVRSEHKMIETGSSSQSAGIPGVKGGLANKLQGNTGLNGDTSSKTRQQSTTNYEITRLQRQINGAAGKLIRLSVGVMVDGSYKKEKGKIVYVPRTPEQMASIEQIVKAAMGFNEERGDEVSVANIAFSATEKGPGKMDRILTIGSKLIRPFANLVLALIFIFLVLRPLLNRFVLSPATEGGEATELTEETQAIEGTGMPGLEPPKVFEPLPDVTNELRDLANEYPERAAALIKIWLREKMETEDANAA